MIIESPNPGLVHGLYAIADTTLLSRLNLVDAVAAAIRGGATLIQYRAKAVDTAERLEQARQLLAVCRPLGIPLIINDNVALARALDADGVHVGRDDAPVRTVRRELGPGRIVGASCYNEFELAQNAERDGADYVAFGSFFPSPTKPDAVRAEQALLERARAELQIPAVAIGGIRPDEGAPLVAAGAAALAVASGVFAQADPERAARQYAQAFAARHPDAP